MKLSRELHESVPGVAFWLEGDMFLADSEPYKN